MRDIPDPEKLDKVEIATYCIFIGCRVSAARDEW
jgi:hypothetical protein